MNEKAKILFFCMIFVGSNVFAQKKVYSSFAPPQIFKGSSNSYNDFINTGRLNKIAFAASFATIPQLLNELTFAGNTTVPQKIVGGVVNYNSIIITSLPQNFYTRNFGFFCKKELQLEKVTKIPFKFRLGSVQQCDWMEGKANAGIKSF